MRTLAPLGMIACAALAACGTHNGVRPQAQAQRDAAASASPVDEVAHLLAGSFSSAAQSVSDPTYFDIRLSMVPIWSQRAGEGERWLYVEQAMSESLASPYRQRIYRVRPGQAGTVVSEVYELPGDPLRFASFVSADPARFDAIAPTDLTRKDGCDVVLVRKGPSLWEGATVGTGCASTRNGAQYTTSQVLLDAEGMTSWDRGFDGAGRQVWGAVKGGYRFDREKREW